MVEQLDLVVAACTTAALLTAQRMLSLPASTDQRAGSPRLAPDDRRRRGAQRRPPVRPLPLRLRGARRPLAGARGPGAMRAGARSLRSAGCSARSLAGVALALAGALVFFVLFPRLSWNVAARRGGASLGAATTGFADGLRLGGSGRAQVQPAGGVPGAHRSGPRHRGARRRTGWDAGSTASTACSGPPPAVPDLRSGRWCWGAPEPGLRAPGDRPAPRLRQPHAGGAGHSGRSSVTPSCTSPPSPSGPSWCPRGTARCGWSGPSEHVTYRAFSAAGPGSSRRSWTTPSDSGGSSCRHGLDPRIPALADTLRAGRQRRSRRRPAARARPPDRLRVHARAARAGEGSAGRLPLRAPRRALRGLRHRARGAAAGPADPRPGGGGLPRGRARRGRVPGARRRCARLGRGGGRRTGPPSGRHAAPAPIGGRGRPRRLAPRPLGGAADPLAGPGGRVLAVGPGPPGTGHPLERDATAKAAARPASRTDGNGAVALGVLGRRAPSRRAPRTAGRRRRRRARSAGRCSGCCAGAAGSGPRGWLDGARVDEAELAPGARGHRPLPRGAVRQASARERARADGWCGRPGRRSGPRPPLPLRRLRPQRPGRDHPPRPSRFPRPHRPTCPPGRRPEIRPYTGIEDRPGQSTPEVRPERAAPRGAGVARPAARAAATGTGD